MQIFKIQESEHIESNLSNFIGNWGTTRTIVNVMYDDCYYFIVKLQQVYYYNNQ